MHARISVPGSVLQRNLVSEIQVLQQQTDQGSQCRFELMVSGWIDPFTQMRAHTKKSLAVARGVW